MKSVQIRSNWFKCGHSPYVVQVLTKHWHIFLAIGKALTCLNIEKCSNYTKHCIKMTQIGAKWIKLKKKTLWWLFVLPAKNHSLVGQSVKNVLFNPALPSKSHLGILISVAFLKSQVDMKMKTSNKCWK